jgi:hypothetical protein
LDSGATFPTGIDALQVYCDVLPLQLRRDRFTVSAFQRVIRLSVSHPIFLDFLDCSVVARHSIFTRVSAVMFRLGRYSLFSDGGSTLAEPFPVIDEGYLPLTPTHSFLSRRSAVAVHDSIFCLQSSSLFSLCLHSGVAAFTSIGSGMLPATRSI